MRREPVTSIHPLVRTHPVTGEKALYINPQFSRRIVGFKNGLSLFEVVVRIDLLHDDRTFLPLTC